MRKPCSKKLIKNPHDEIFIINKNENLEISSINHNEIQHFFTTFKDCIQNENQFYCVNFIASYSKADIWPIILKSATIFLSKNELSEFISDIFISEINVFNTEVKELLYECVHKYPNSELSDISYGYLELYASEYKNI